MPWDMATCVNGVPNPFTNADAINLVTNANFANSTFVQVHNNGLTKSAFLMVPFGGMTVCVVGHIHLQPGQAPAAGNCYIPGWQNWAMQTPAAQVIAIDAAPAAGLFPGANRYPH